MSTDLGPYKDWYDAKISWEAKVKAFDGHISLWIDQEHEPILMQNNSKGICYALTLIYIQYSIDPSLDDDYFFSQLLSNYSIIITKITDQQNLYSVPLVDEDFLLKQKTLEQDWEKKTNRLIQYWRREDRLKRKLAILQFSAHTEQQVNAEEIRKVESDLTEQEALVKDLETTLYPQLCIIRNEETPIDKAPSLLEFFHTYTTIAPIYAMIRIMGKGEEEGHVIGLTLKEDWYNLFDANLGLISFPNYNKLARFFSSEIVTKYQSQGQTLMILDMVQAIP